MAYLGLQPQTKTVGTSTQTLTGNGVDLEFSLNRAVSKAADILVFVGNVVQVPETDYTATDNTLLFGAGNTPANASVISVNYKAGALSTTYVTANAYPVGTTTTPSIRSVDAVGTGIYWPTTTSVGITVSGNTRVTVSDVSAGAASSTTSGALRVVGGAGITQRLYVGGDTHIESTTDATSTADGALNVLGGVGIAKSTFIGGDLNVEGDFTVAGQFTTTGSDSLSVNDPFIFLANANPGDNLDSGFVSTYNDGSINRYTGLFRDITDGQYKLFSNLSVQPTTVVDTANVSFVLANLVVGNITATNLYGNISNTQDITILGNLANLSVQGTVKSYDINYIYVTTPSTSTTSGALQVGGGVGIAGNLNVGGTTNKFTNNTASTSTTTGVLQVSGGVGIAGNLNVGGTTNNFAGNILPTANVTYNLGSTTAWWSTVYATASQAKYADLAENYLADTDYEPGTVLHFGGDREVSLCDTDMCTRVAGVVSTNPAHLMNTELEGKNVVALALTGRVPTKVVGSVKKGDMMVSAGGGRARAETHPRVGSVIGKALENFDGTEGVIEVVIGKH